MENENQKIRKYIRNLEKGGQNLFILPFSLEKLPLQYQIFYIEIEQVLFMDLYKQLRYQMRTQNLVDKDFGLLPFVDGICDLASIHQTMVENPSFFLAAFSATCNFYEANALEKRAQVKSLSREDEKHLLEISPDFKKDLQMYDRPLALQDYYNYFDKVATFYEKRGLAYLEQTIEEQIGYFIQNLYLYDEENCVQNILELSTIDYIWSKEFLESGEYPDIASGRQNAIHRMMMFENDSDKEIVMHSVKEIAYLTDLIYTYFYAREICCTKEAFEQKKRDFICEKETIKEKIKRRSDEWK